MGQRKRGGLVSRGLYGDASRAGVTRLRARVLIEVFSSPLPPGCRRHLFLPLDPALTRAIRRLYNTWLRTDYGEVRHTGVGSANGRRTTWHFLRLDTIMTYDEPHGAFTICRVWPKPKKGRV